MLKLLQVMKRWERRMLQEEPLMTTLADLDEELKRNMKNKRFQVYTGEELIGAAFFEISF